MPPEFVRFMCPKLRCRAILTAPVSARGRDVRCPHCSTRIKIPSQKKNGPQQDNQETFVEPI